MKRPEVGSDEARTPLSTKFCRNGLLETESIPAESLSSLAISALGGSACGHGAGNDLNHPVS